jgi:hypothetical protein
MKRSWIARCAVVALLAGALAIPVASSADPPNPMPVNPDRQCSADNLQTFDPLSPPCIPFWQGDNGGPTYDPGVMADEVRVVLWSPGGINYINGSDPSNRATPAGQLFDLFKTPSENQQANQQSPTKPEHLVVKGARVWQAYFNKRFETYSRKLHFYVYFSRCPSDCGPGEVRADAIAISQRVRPFAVVPESDVDAKMELAAEFVANGSIVVGSFGQLTSELNAIEPGKVWDRWPSVERQADAYASFVCQRVINRPASLAGGELSGLPRRLGLLYTTDPDQPGLTALAAAVRARITACGGVIAGEATYSSCCTARDNGENPTDFVLQLTQLRLKGVTTILWPGGFDGSYPQAAAATLYRPEWFLAGDGVGDGNLAPQLSGAGDAFHRRAFVVTPQPFEPSFAEKYCARAFREIDQTTAQSDLSYVCDDYSDLHLLVSGIQMAGPNLHPGNVDLAFHSMPARPSAGQQSPACWFPSGDHTCIKDAQVKWWDATGPDASGRPGCWRTFEAGRRRMPGEWQGPELATSMRADDPCDAYSRATRFNLA